MRAFKALLCRWLIICVFLITGFASRAQLSANFSATPTSGCSPLLVTFTDLSAGNPTSWKWDLGNGTISFLQNPAVTYFVPGQYNIKLVVQNSLGKDSVIKSQFINVQSQPAVAFSGQPLTGCYPLPVNFTDLSSAGTGTISTWEWDFGDGTLASTQNPSHIYTGSGNYNVSLRVTNNFGCFKTLTKSQYVQISTGVHAAFTTSVPFSCSAPISINFQNISSGTGLLTYQWDFGDGTGSLLTNPTHTYNLAGSYTVKLIVTNSAGCTDTLIKPNAISVGSVSPNFNMPASICQGVGVTFTNTSTPLPGGALWNFGDGTTFNAINPVKVYNTPGNYTVKMVANFGACLDSITKPISVLASPVVTFSADKTAGCQPPLSVNFSQAVPAATTYFWDFGDGTTSILANPNHIYNTPGSFNVKLKITNASGCTDSLVKTNYILVQAPVVTINGLPKNGCVPLAQPFSAAITSVDPVTSYLWNFGDGATSILANPVHTYVTAGSYTVTVTITTAGGCTAVGMVRGGILVGNHPSANFTAAPINVCPLEFVNFTDLSTGAADQWLWDFGDGGMSYDKNPTHQYSDTGWLDIKLVVWSSGCADTVKFVKYVHVNPPIANFAINPTCKPAFTKSFTDASLGADSWSWTFGDGSTSSLKNPSHTYADTGTYTVHLVVTNNASGCTHFKDIDVQVVNEVANFASNDTVICKKNWANFHTIGIHMAKVVTYTWDFGDGAIVVDSTGSIGHIYAGAGTYTVSLVIKDVLGCTDTLVRPQYIRVDGPTSAFTTLTPAICLNGTVVFNDGSVSDGLHPIQQWIWKYGDGTTDTLGSPPFTHKYTAPGVYSVELKLTDSKGCVDSLVKLQYITVSKPTALFTADSISCTTGVISFNNSSIGNVLAYTWNFGDGTTSSSPSPVHTYTSEGTYTVTLSIVDQFGCTDTLTRSSYIKVIDAKANFSMSDSLSTCPPLVVSFTNSSINVVSLSWDFGDGTSSTLLNPTHFYSVSGVYNVVLSVIGPGGCTAVKIRQVVIRGPQGSFTYTNFNGCTPLITNFVAHTRDNLSFVWDFNDGTTISTLDSNMSHTYTTPGSYLPKIILVDAGGCQVPIIGIDTIKVYDVAVDFTLSASAICDSGSIAFNSTSITNDAIATYLWNFGDGTTSAIANPVHSYNTTGAYTTSLIITTMSGCKDTMIKASPIKIVKSPDIGIASPNGACIPASFNFTGQILVPDTSAVTWLWNLGNGSISTLQNPPAQLYPTAGSYNISVIATNSSGCKDSSTKVIQAYPIPVINAGVDTIFCKGQSITLNATGGASYVWSPAIKLSCTNCPDPVATPDSAINYIVQGTSVNGCISHDTVAMTVRLPFKLTVGKGDTLCKGEAARLTVGNAATYIWSPALGLNDPTSATPVATPLLTTTYKVVGSDDKGCFKDTAFVPVIVYPYPVVNAGVDKTIAVGSTIDLIPTTSADVTKVNWAPTSGIFRSNPPAITVKPNQTTEYTVEATNPGGCVSRDKVTVFVVCDNANVYLPNTFSPNGDGINDVFYLRGSGLFTVRSFRIFNRWGEIVFERTMVNPNDISFGWDGTFKGAALPPDVFVYTAEVICNNNTPLIFKGNVALIK